jgi:hypothetical protein
MAISAGDNLTWVFYLQGEWMIKFFYHQYDYLF